MGINNQSKTRPRATWRSRIVNWCCDCYKWVSSKRHKKQKENFKQHFAKNLQILLKTIREKTCVFLNRINFNFRLMHPSNKRRATQNYVTSKHTYSHPLNYFLVGRSYFVATVNIYNDGIGFWRTRKTSTSVSRPYWFLRKTSAFYFCSLSRQKPVKNRKKKTENAVEFKKKKTSTRKLSMVKSTGE